MEEGGRSHFILEVDDLNHRITNLRDTVTNLFEAVNKRRSETTTALQLVQESAAVIQEVSTALVSASQPGGDGGPDLSGQFMVSDDLVSQLAALRDQLLQLSLAEGRLATSSILPAQSSANHLTALVPYNRNR